MAEDDIPEISEEALKAEFEKAGDKKTEGERFNIKNIKFPKIDKKVLIVTPIIIIILVVLYFSQPFILNFFRNEPVGAGIINGTNCSSLNVDSYDDTTITISNNGCDSISYIQIGVGDEIYDFELEDELEPEEEITLNFGELEKCGDGHCGVTENYFTCSEDCPYCNDNKEETLNLYDYTNQECENPGFGYKLLFEDEFNNTLSNWEDVLGSNSWRIEDEELILDAQSSTIMPALKIDNFNFANDEYSFQGRAKITTGQLQIHAKSSMDGREYVVFLNENEVILLRQDNSENTPLNIIRKELENYLKPEEWFNFELTKKDNNIYFFIDEVQVINFKDENPFNYNTFQLQISGVTENNNTKYTGSARFDNIRILLRNYDIIEQDCEGIRVIFEEEFTNDLSNWEDAFETNTWSIQEQSLLTIVTEEQKTYPLLLTKVNSADNNLAYENKFMIMEGVALLMFKISEDYENYYILIVGENDVLLSKSTESLQALQYNTLSLARMEWNNIKIILLEDKIIIYINDDKVIDYTENNMLSGNNFGVGAYPQVFEENYTQGLIRFDDIQISEVNEQNYLC